MSTVNIQSALEEILNQPQRPLDEVLERYFSPEYRQRTDGHWDDREAFKRHLAKLRELVASAEITVLDELRDGDRYASRHRVQIHKRDGTHAVQEVYLFARLDVQGFVLQVEEATLMLEGSEADREIGRVK
jgi:hypothetical protein